MRALSFRELKAQISITDVLAHYLGAEGLPEPRGEQLRLHCPICGYQKTKALSVHTGRNIYKCHHCESQGNIFNFVADMEDIDEPAAARTLTEWFGGTDTGKGRQRAQKRSERRQEAQETPEKRGFTAAHDGPPAATANKQLRFTLKGLDPGHERVRALGFSSSTVERCGIAYYGGRGLVRDTVVMPLHTISGALVGYATLAADGGKITATPPPAEYFCPAADVIGLDMAEKGEIITLVRDLGSLPLMLERHETHAIAFMGDVLSDEQLAQIADVSNGCALSYATTGDEDAGALAGTVMALLGIVDSLTITHI